MNAQWRLWFSQARRGFSIRKRTRRIQRSFVDSPVRAAGGDWTREAVRLDSERRRGFKCQRSREAGRSVCLVAA